MNKEHNTRTIRSVKKKTWEQKMERLSKLSKAIKRGAREIRRRIKKISEALARGREEKPILDRYSPPTPQMGRC